jgi:flavin reductase (DIM6/NTAB) family NADH-FMN oxidoreductase RutF
MRSAMGCFATGVTIVAALEDRNPIGFTCQSFVSLSLNPPLVAICPGRSSTSWPRMVAAGRFSVNVLSDQQVEICAGFARSGVDKFHDVSWYIGPNGTPLIHDVVASVECEMVVAHEAGDHEIVIGRVLAAETSTRAPLLFFRSQLTTLGSGVTA